MTQSLREVDLGSEPRGARSDITVSKIYISGPMTGYPEYNLPAFSSAEQVLRMSGYTAINPGWRGVVEGKTWQDYMRDAFRDLVECDGMAMLPGWSTSKGASLEWTVGNALGMDIRELADWL